MSALATVPAAVTPQQVLGNLLAITKESAQSVEAGVSAQPRTLGLAIAAANDMATVGLLTMGTTRPPTRNPFTF